MKAETRRRLAVLEAARSPEDQGPSVIYLVGCERQPDGTIGGEVSGALFIPGGSIARSEGETEADFIARAEGVAEGRTGGAQLVGDVPLTDAGRLDASKLADGTLHKLLNMRRGAFRETDGGTSNGQ